MNLRSPITILAGAALEPWRRVKHNGTNWVYAGAGENHDAVTGERIASGEYGGAYLANDNMIFEVAASGAITLGAACYGDANGMITATRKGGAIMKCLKATTNSGDVAEASRINGGNAEVYEAVATASAGDDTNNYIDVDTGFGQAPTGPVHPMIRSTTGVHRAPQGIVTLNADGTIRVADSGLAVNEKLHIRAVR